MAIAVSTLTRGPAYLNYNSANFFTREDITTPRNPDFEQIMTSMGGRIDAVKKNFKIPISLRLWGAWENLSIIFPSYLTNPTPGGIVFGGANAPLVITARNNDQITLVNAQVTKLAALYLGVDSHLFAADLEFTGVIGRDGSANLLTPETASSYSTLATGSYADATAAFAKTNFKRVRFTGAWGAITGFTAIVPQKGVQVSSDAKLNDFDIDGYGTVDMTVEDMVASCKAIPIGPTLAQIKTNSMEEAVFGSLASASAADLVWTGAAGAPVVTIKGAYMKQSGLAFGTSPMRVGETMWESTRSVSSGALSAVLTVS